MEVSEVMGGLTRKDLKRVFEKAVQHSEDMTVDEIVIYVGAINADYIADFRPGDIVQVYGYPYEMVVDEYCILKLNGRRFIPDDEPPDPVRCSLYLDEKRHLYSFPALQVELICRPEVSTPP